MKRKKSTFRRSKYTGTTTKQIQQAIKKIEAGPGWRSQLVKKSRGVIINDK